jgi:hypothetical protein
VSDAARKQEPTSEENAIRAAITDVETSRLLKNTFVNFSYSGKSYVC